ncbi:hypothetical protein GCM10020331_061540 [Ectobacillus funiculus]
MLPLHGEYGLSFYVTMSVLLINSVVVYFNRFLEPNVSRERKNGFLKKERKTLFNEVYLLLSGS